MTIIDYWYFEVNPKKGQPYSVKIGSTKKAKAFDKKFTTMGCKGKLKSFLSTDFDEHTLKEESDFYELSYTDLIK